MSIADTVCRLFKFNFSIVDYLLEKAADAGTGRLWPDLWARAKQSGGSAIETGLYEAIEKATRAFLPEACGDDQAACIYERILHSWCLHKYLNNDDIRQAFGRSGFIERVQPEDWLYLFYQNIYANDSLKDYIAMYQNREILQLLDRLVAQQNSRNIEASQISPARASRQPLDIRRTPDFGTSIRHGELKEYVDGFVGREKDLDSIKNILAGHNVAVISAGPGYGKTSLAVKYGQNNEKYYDRIVFISCETAVDIYRSLNMIYENEEDCDLGVRGNIVRRIRMLIEGAGRPLLIFDNYGYDHIAEYQKLGALENALRAVIDELNEDYVNLDMIVTTRITQTLFQQQKIYSMNEMEDGDAIIYLRQGNDYFSDEDCLGIIRQWGTLPIVLNMVKTVTRICGSYGEVSSIYMNLSGGVHDNLYLLFKKLFKELQETEEGRIFAEILRLSCLLDSDNIQKELLFRALANSPMASDRSRFDMIMAEYIRRLNILRGTGGSYAIHRMYQETIRHLLSRPKRQALQQCIVRELRDKLHWFSYYGYSEWERMKDYLNHIDRLYVVMDEEERGDYADLFLQSAWYSGYVINDFALYNKYKKAIASGKASETEAYIRGMALCDDLLIHMHSGQKMDHIQAPDVWFQIESLLETLSGHDEAIVYVRYCLCRSEYEERNSGYDIALDWAEKGVKRCLRGDSGDTDELFLETAFFPEHLMLLKNQLGKLYRQQAQTDQAIDMFSQVLKVITDIEKKTFEPDNNYDVIKAFTVNSIAVCYYERNRSNSDLKNALIYYKVVYDIYKRLQYYYGTVNELLNCAAIYRLLALNMLEYWQKSECCEITADEFRKEFTESLIPQLLSASMETISNNESADENPDFEVGLMNGLPLGLAVYQGYLYNARCCLDAIEVTRKQGVRISKKLLKDLYTYHYEMGIADSRHPLLSVEQEMEILKEAGDWLEKSMEITKKEGYKTDMCRQERYMGVLYRKRAALTDGAEKQALLDKSVDVLEAAVKDSEKYQLMTGFYYASMELALACYNNEDIFRAYKILHDLEPEITGCSQDSVKKRYDVVKAMVKFNEELQ